jgi:hypothetical protein
MAGESRVVAVDTQDNVWQEELDEDDGRAGES